MMNNTDTDSLVFNFVGDKEYCIFSPLFAEQPVVKQLLAMHYSDAAEDWQEKIDLGRILYSPEDIHKATEILDLEPGELFAIYKEKNRSRTISFLLDDALVVNNSLHVDLEDCTTKGLDIYIKGELYQDICMSDTVNALIQDYKNLINTSHDYILEHPISNCSLEERNNYFILLVLFCLKEKGLTGHQIFHLGDIARSFHIGSRELAVGLDFYKDFAPVQFRSLFAEIFLTIPEEQRYFLLRDIAYLLVAGNYPAYKLSDIEDTILKNFNIKDNHLQSLVYEIKALVSEATSNSINKSNLYRLSGVENEAVIAELLQTDLTQHKAYRKAYKKLVGEQYAKIAFIDRFAKTTIVVFASLAIIMIAGIFWFSNPEEPLVPATPATKASEIIQASQKQNADTIHLGDLVEFKGNTHYVNSGSTAKAITVSPGKARVTLIKEGAAHPYHIVTIDSQSIVHGWVDAKDVEKIQQQGAPEKASDTNTEQKTEQPATQN